MQQITCTCSTPSAMNGVNLRAGIEGRNQRCLQAPGQGLAPSGLQGYMLRSSIKFESFAPLTAEANPDPTVGVASRPAQGC